jgi:hypothetical protein
MPTAGRTTTSGNNFWAQNTGSNNQYGYAISMSESGLIEYLDVFMAGAAGGGGCRTILCLWDSSGNLLAQTAQFTAGAGGGGVNGQAFQRQPLITPYPAAAGTYHIGFWRNAADTADFSFINSGGTIHPQAPGGGIGNVGSPGALSFANSTTGQMSAFVEYVRGGIKLASGGVFSKYAVKRWSSGASAWQRHPLKRWNASNSTWEWFA